MSSQSASAHTRHDPVLLAEVISWLQPRSGGRYLDATFGGGGHTAAILNAAAPEGRVLALDADPAAIERSRPLTTTFGDHLRVVHANFEGMTAVATAEGFAPLDGVLMDLGLSSFQLDDPERGFAFRFDGPLDMRFDHTQGLSAADLVNSLPAEDLADIFWRYGDESRSRRIAGAIVRERANGTLESTAQLAKIIERAVGGRKGADTHPATRSFQALRIAVNNELSVLETALAGAVELLAPGGRVAVIAFHSIEDRIVKHFFQHESAACICPPEQPVCTCQHQARLRTLTRAVKPSKEEIARNSRSRSAVLRVAERLS